jgi:hypothetical protein
MNALGLALLFAADILSTGATLPNGQQRAVDPVAPAKATTGVRHRHDAQHLHPIAGDPIQRVLERTIPDHGMALPRDRPALLTLQKLLEHPTSGATAGQFVCAPTGCRAIMKYATPAAFNAFDVGRVNSPTSALRRWNGSGGRTALLRSPQGLVATWYILDSPDEMTVPDKALLSTAALRGALR